MTVQKTKAHRLTPHWWDEDNNDHPDWLQAALEDGRMFERDGFQMLKTPDGDRPVSMGDYIVLDAQGDLHAWTASAYEAANREG